jgi:hypothetical protein
MTYCSSEVNPAGKSAVSITGDRAPSMVLAWLYGACGVVAALNLLTRLWEMFFGVTHYFGWAAHENQLLALQGLYAVMFSALWWWTLQARRQGLAGRFTSLRRVGLVSSVLAVVVVAWVLWTMAHSGTDLVDVASCTLVFGGFAWASARLVRVTAPIS